MRALARLLVTSAQHSARRWIDVLKRLLATETAQVRSLSSPPGLVIDLCSGRPSRPCLSPWRPLSTRASASAGRSNRKYSPSSVVPRSTKMSAAGLSSPHLMRFLIAHAAPRRFCDRYVSPSDVLNIMAEFGWELVSSCASDSTTPSDSKVRLSFHMGCSKRSVISQCRARPTARSRAPVHLYQARLGAPRALLSSTLYYAFNANKAVSHCCVVLQ